MPNKQTKELFKLPPDAAMSEAGPELRSFLRVLTIGLDVPSDDGQRRIELRANGVIAVRFAADFVMDEYVSTSYNCVCEILESKWLACLKNRASSPLKKAHAVQRSRVLDPARRVETARNRLLQRAARDMRQIVSESSRHFVLFVDHHGYIEFIGESVENVLV